MCCVWLMGHAIMLSMVTLSPSPITRKKKQIKNKSETSRNEFCSADKLKTNAFSSQLNSPANRTSIFRFYISLLSSSPKPEMRRVVIWRNIHLRLISFMITDSEHFRMKMKMIFKLLSINRVPLNVDVDKLGVCSNGHSYLVTWSVSQFHFNLFV